MTTRADAFDDVEYRAQLMVAALLGQLQQRRRELGLRQEDVAQRSGVSKVAVTRMESSEGNPTLHNFARVALALNVQPNLAGTSQEQTPPREVVHRGLAHSRTSASIEGKDREREAAFAASWEDVNRWRSVGVQSLMPALVPGHTQEQATAAATAIQWLGSQVGFVFLEGVLESCGYKIVEKAAAPKSHLGMWRSKGKRTTE